MRENKLITIKKSGVKMRKMYLILMLTWIMVLTSCSDNGTEPQSNDMIPLKSGYKWKYFVDFNGVNSWTETLTCKAYGGKYYDITDGFGNAEFKFEVDANFVKMTFPFSFSHYKYSLTTDTLTKFDVIQYDEYTVKLERGKGIVKYIHKDTYYNNTWTYTLIEFTK